MNRRVLAFLIALAVGGAVAIPCWAAETVLRPGPSGGLGLWLAAGPLFGSDRGLRFTTRAEGPDDPRLIVAVADGATVRPGMELRPLAARAGRFDLRKQFRAPRARAFALFAAVLRAEKASQLLLQIGADDGVRVTLDGEVVLDRDLWRPALHDDDAVELNLAPGDHALLVRLRQRSGAWHFRARLLDADDLLPPRDVRFVLPGVDPEHAARHVSRLVDVSVGLHLDAERYVPNLRVNAEGGFPVGNLLPVIVDAVAQHDEHEPVPLFRSAVGALPVGPRRVHPVEARLPPIDGASLVHEGQEAEMVFEIDVNGHGTTLTRRGHPIVRAAIGAVDRAIAHQRAAEPDVSKDPSVVRATLELSRDRLETFVSQGDDDLDATRDEAAAVRAFADHVLAHRDPLFSTRGPVRLAYPSPLDGKNRPFGAYVPPSFGTDRAPDDYPLVVVLHGLHGLPMQMLRIFFGKDHWRRAPWEDRHVGKLPPLDAFVVSPTGFGNTAYREFGEMDVMHLVEWMRRTYPIDADRVYVTGLSMGGTGAGAIGLRYADQFAAIEPLCGYHSYALRRDMANRKLRPWEEALASFWSNVSWAGNGRNLPLYVVHGKKDKPVANSGVLIDRYKQLGYRVHAEHPDLGHNVWRRTYDGFKGYRWLARHERDPEPAEVVLETPSLRYADHAWVHVVNLGEHLRWGRVRAQVRSRHRISLTTSGVQALRLDRPASRIDMEATLQVECDGDVLKFEPGETVAMHRTEQGWGAEPPVREEGLRKVAGLTGPIRDAFLEPLVFVVGTRDPSLTRVNWYVAKALSEPPYGVEARWPIVADVDVDEELASSHTLFLIGAAGANAYVSKISDRLPIRVEAESVRAGGSSFKGEEIGTLYVYPNPQHPRRYVVVLAAPDVAGTLRALSLPRMLPDFVIYDRAVAGARGQIVLGSASLRAGGMFDAGWRLPDDLGDSSAR